MKVLHIITGLSTGGAQAALYKLLDHLDLALFQTEVVSLTKDEPVGKQIRTLGVPVFALGGRPGLPDPRLLSRIREHIRRFNPDIVQTWMYHADFLGGLAARSVGKFPVVWNIRHTLTRATDVKRSTLLVARANAILSNWIPSAIICCAATALESHARMGYRREKMVVIPNGFDLQLIHPDDSVRHQLRNQLGLDHNTLIIGMCGRFDPQKDHQNFIRAAGLLHRHIPAARFVLWGEGITSQNPMLQDWIRAEGLEDCTYLLGYQSESHRINLCLDVATLSSAYGEAFPNVIGEAMASGVPCVVTDVGDAAHIVGSSGLIVPPRDPLALAGAWEELLMRSEQDRKQLGLEARQRIVEHFDIVRVAQTYAALYQDIISASPSP